MVKGGLTFLNELAFSDYDSEEEKLLIFFSFHSESIHEIHFIDLLDGLGCERMGTKTYGNRL